MFRIKKKDTVLVKAGKDKGKQGEVIKVFHEKKRAVVSKLNIVKKHTKPTQQNPGGVVEREASIHISNLQVVCPKCSKPTRVKYDRLDNKETVRVCKKCGEMIV